MGVSMRELWGLQQLEQEIAAGEQVLKRAQAQLGDSPALRQARANHAQAKAALEALACEQRETESAVADLSAKMAAANESLFSGRTHNPKELQGLQHEVEGLKSRRNPLEERDLKLMEDLEAAQARLKDFAAAQAAAEAQAVEEQKELHALIEKNRQSLAILKEKRSALLPMVAPADLALYQQVQQAKSPAMALVEQGACKACRMNLSSAEVQRTRGGATVQCSSCGRLLFCE
jgi:uncharacterized protein